MKHLTARLIRERGRIIPIALLVIVGSVVFATAYISAAGPSPDPMYRPADSFRGTPAHQAAVEDTITPSERIYLPLAIKQPMPTATRKPTATLVIATPTARATATPTATRTPTPAVTYKIWHSWEGEVAATYRALADEFVAAHPEVAVELLQIPSDQLVNKLTMEVAAGGGPDIAVVYGSSVGELRSNGIIRPLVHWISPDGLQAIFERAISRTVILGGQVWGLPAEQTGIALAYNRSLITDAMLPESYDFNDLLNRAVQFRTEHPDKYYLCQIPDAYWSAPVFFGHGMDQYGGFVDETGRPYMNTAEALAAAQWLALLRPYAPAQAGYSECVQMFRSAQAAMRWAGPWDLSSFRDLGFSYGIAAMGSPFVQGSVFVMSANPRGSDMVYLVMSYFTSAAAQKRLALAAGVIPANTAALHDLEVQANADIARFGTAFSLGTPLAGHQYVGCQWTPVREAVRAIWDGTKTPEQAMQQAQAAIAQCTGWHGTSSQ